MKEAEGGSETYVTNVRLLSSSLAALQGDFVDSLSYRILLYSVEYTHRISSRNLSWCIRKESMYSDM